MFFTTLVNGIQSADIKESKKNLLKKLVSINSGTRNILGLNKIRKVLIKEFEKIGFMTNIIELKPNSKNSSVRISKFKNLQYFFLDISIHI